MTPADSPDAALARLGKTLAGLAPGLVAVSGGVDSRVLAAAAHRANLGFQAAHFSGPHLSTQETAEALDWLRDLGLPFHVLRFDPLAIPEVRANGPLRCLHCKRALFLRAWELARGLDLRSVLDGTTASDAAAYRPGRAALAELGVASPLETAGLGKPMVRSLAVKLGLARPDQPSRPCLLTRFAYDLEPDHETLERLALAEESLARLGLHRFRVRVLAPGEYALQLDQREAAGEGLVARARKALASQGFASVRVLATAGVSGFFDNAVLSAMAATPSNSPFAP